MEEPKLKSMWFGSRCLVVKTLTIVRERDIYMDIYGYICVYMNIYICTHTNIYIFIDTYSYMHI